MTRDQALGLQRALAGKGYAIACDGVWGPISQRTLDRHLGAHVLTGPLELLALVEEAAYRTGAIGPRTDADEDEAARWLAGHRVEDETIAQHFAGLRHAYPGGLGPDALVAHVAEWLHDRPVREVRQNRGPWVDTIVRIGGGNPETAPAWCAYTVAASRRIAEWLHGPGFGNYWTSGGAVRTWQKFPDAQRSRGNGTLPPIGAAFHRLRTSLPDADVRRTLEAAWRGDGVEGHTGTVVDYLDDGDLLCIAGNSSGSGHAGHTSGAVAYEIVGPTRGKAAWDRLVGFTWIEND